MARTGIAARAAAHSAVAPTSAAASAALPAIPPQTAGANHQGGRLLRGLRSRRGAICSLPFIGTILCATPEVAGQRPHAGANQRAFAAILPATYDGTGHCAQRAAHEPCESEVARYESRRRDAADGAGRADQGQQGCQCHHHQQRRQGADATLLRLRRSGEAERHTAEQTGHAAAGGAGAEGQPALAPVVSAASRDGL